MTYHKDPKQNKNTSKIFAFAIHPSTEQGQVSGFNLLNQVICWNLSI